MCRNLPPDLELTEDPGGRDPRTGKAATAGRWLLVPINTATATYTIWEITGDPLLAISAGAAVAAMQRLV